MTTTSSAIAVLALLSATACAVDPADDPETADTPDIAGSVAVKVLRGADRASAFSDAEARTLARSHGVKWSGVYIGGACDAGSGWDEARVASLHRATGWEFMPIWVGQQSPGICGAHELTHARGEDDGAAAANRMKAFGWEPDRDIPVALDVEAGTFEYSAHDSASYVHGWVKAVHEAGYRAYVYSSPTGVARFHDDKLGVDGGWVASYFYDEFRKLEPSDLHQIGERFSHHNRAWQYAGGFEVHGVGRVDADTSDLLLAPPPHGTNRKKTATACVAITCGGLGAGEGLVHGQSVASCDGNTKLEMTDDGDLVLSRFGERVWTSGTAGVGATAVLGTDGNFAVYDADQEVVYTSETGGNPDARLELADGMRVIDDAGGQLRSFAE